MMSKSENSRFRLEVQDYARAFFVFFFVVFFFAAFFFAGIMLNANR